MNEVEIPVTQDPNFDMLSQQLMAAIPNCTGLAYAIGSLKTRVLFANTVPSPGEISAAQSICAAHDPTQKTPAQQTAAQVGAATTNLLGKIKNEVAYFNAVPAPDLTNGVALARLCTDFAALLVAMSTRLN